MKTRARSKNKRFTMARVRSMKHGEQDAFFSWAPAQAFFQPKVASPQTQAATDRATRTGMPAELLQKSESFFQTNFAALRVHTNSKKAQAMDALAYTQGQSIHLAPGQFQPETTRGRELLGHELTHVVQQTQGRVRATDRVNGMDVNEDPVLEREANVAGRRFATIGDASRTRDGIGLHSGMLSAERAGQLTTGCVSQPAQFGKKQGKKQAGGKAPKSAAGGSSSEKQEFVPFPHGGKHQPPAFTGKGSGRKAVAGDPKAVAAQTSGKGNPALYLSNDAATVIGHEKTAIAQGYRLHDGFTIVHRLGEVIGADQGELTRCIRMDGEHHGHPIQLSGSKQSFLSYIQAEIDWLSAELAKNPGDDQLKEIRQRLLAYLLSIGMPPETQFKKWPKDPDADGGGGGGAASASVPVPAH